MVFGEWSETSKRVSQKMLQVSLLVMIFDRTESDFVI
jgi:hypothetical protein